MSDVTATVPVVGKVTFVAAEVVKVKASAPARVKLPDAGVKPVTVSALPVKSAVKVPIITVFPLVSIVNSVPLVPTAKVPSTVNND